MQEYHSVMPLQFFGVGDVTFTIHLVEKVAEGKPIIWGVNNNLVEQLSRAYPQITWVDARLLNIDYNRKDDYVLNGTRILPIRWSVDILRVPYKQCMRSKYDMYGVDWRDWNKYNNYQRDMNREKRLFQSLGLTEGEPFTLINRTFRTDLSKRADIRVSNGLKHVEMRYIEGYSLFDWSYTIQQATEIHTVSTSIIYLLEMLELKAKHIGIYIRRPDETSHEYYDYILRSHDYTLY